MNQKSNYEIGWLIVGAAICGLSVGLVGVPLLALANTVISWLFGVALHF